jgi:hypothetical protein
MQDMQPTMLNRNRHFADLRALLKAMPPGTLDRERIEALERRHGHRFADPPELVERWLLDEQRRAQAR